jgi:hypothetical protein
MCARIVAYFFGAPIEMERSSLILSIFSVEDQIVICPISSPDTCWLARSLGVLLGKPRNDIAMNWVKRP